MERIVLGTRGSALARTQSEWVAARLREAWPELEVAFELIATRGDKIRDVPLAQIGGKGLFTKELEVALLDGRIDFAVHSLKDLPTELPAGLVIGAVPARENPHDALISHDGSGLKALRQGARLGSSSLRRKLQLLAIRPDLDIVDLRGNVPTRLRRVQEGELDATVLAAAGLRRLGLGDAISEELPSGIMVSAVSQGALGIEIRAGDERMLRLLAVIHDAVAAAEVTAERALLAALGGGCQTPVGALGRVEGERLTLHACVCDPAARRVLRATVEGAASDAQKLGEQAARALLDQGAGAFIRRVEVLGMAAARPLAGKRIVVTRAQSQSGELAKTLIDLGAETFEFATIAIRAVRNPVFPSGNIDWLVFTSRNGVEYFREAAAHASWDEDALQAARVCVVGPATADAAHAAGFTVDLMPPEYAGEAVFEALAEAVGDLHGKRFLLPRGDLARPDLPDELRKAGAIVHEVVVYETFAPEIPEETVQALIEFDPDIVTFTSSSTARNFCARLGTERLETLKRKATFASIGPVTSKTAHEYGIEVMIEPKDYDVPGLVQAIVRYCGKIG